MKTLILLLLGLFASNVFSQSNLKLTKASKVLYYNSGGLTGQSNELLGSVSDSNSHAYNKYLVCFEGVFYETFWSEKYETGIPKCVFRKSDDGITWTNIIRVGDSPAGTTELHPDVYVWREGADINIGIAYINYRGPAAQCRFALSTDAGVTFQPTVQISNNTTRIYSLNGGITGKGDTIAVCWTSADAVNSLAPTYTSVTTNGGLNWSVPTISYPGDDYSDLTDIVIDPTTNIIYTVTFANEQNPHIYRSTNLGSSWTFVKKITDDPVPNLHYNGQILIYKDTLYSIWVHSIAFGGYADRIWFTKSTNGGFNWAPLQRVNDADTLMGAGTNQAGILDFHPTLAFTENGTMYAVWADSRTKSSTNYDSCRINTYISRSTNRGNNWSASYIVNGPSNTNNIKNIYPCVSVKSSGGIDTVLVTWSKLRDINILPTTYLDLTLLIEGFYNAVSNSMVGDTLEVFLHNNFSPYNIVDSSIAYVSSDGEATFTFTSAAEGVNYYIRTKHRNALETWSKSPGQSFSSSYLSYDFTTSSEQAYGSNQLLKGTKYCIYSGDVDQDGTIDLSDLSLIDNDAYGFVSGYVKTDLTGDDFVDLGDLSIADNNAFNFVSVVRP